MKHSMLTALSTALSKPPIMRALGGGHLLNALTKVYRGLWLLVHPRTFLGVAQLFTSWQLRPLLRTQPLLMFKFLDEYLTTDLSRNERAAILLHHYDFLKQRTGADFFAKILDRRFELWQLTVGDADHRIWLWFPRAPYGEGDVTLTFAVDGVDIYSLSFTIGPGSIAGLAARDALYIARVQGKVSKFDQIRDATKACSDVSPAALLLAAAEGIAQALDLEHMIGIGASAHICATNPESFVKAYDEFWKATGGVKLHRNMYHLPVPVPSKSILLVKRVHRSRTHRKRRFKALVKEQAGKAFCDIALPARDQ
jgi:uncharacterized protein